MNISVKTKIRYHGQEYASPDELPAEARSAYQAAMSGISAVASQAMVGKKIVFNGQQFASENEMPAAERKLYDDAIQLFRDNSTTNTASSSSTAWITKGQLLAVLCGFLVLVAIIIALKSAH
jgi:hypothetical protein